MKLFPTICAIAALILPETLAAAASEPPAAAPAPVQPSPEALELARTLAVPRLGFWLGRTTPTEMRDAIKRQLLTSTLATRGPGCDPADPQCAAAADAIAAKHAPATAQMINDAIDRGQALLFDSTMSRAHIRATLAFAGTDAGRAFAASLRATPGKDPTLVSRIMRGIKLPGPPLDEFYDATKDLPRARIKMAPPPPAPPPPARRDR